MSGGIAHQKRMAIIKVLLLCGSGHAREDGNSAQAPALPVFAGTPAPTWMA